MCLQIVSYRLKEEVAGTGFPGSRLSGSKLVQVATGLQQALRLPEQEPVDMLPLGVAVKCKYLSRSLYTKRVSSWRLLSSSQLHSSATLGTVVPYERLAAVPTAITAAPFTIWWQ